MDGSPGGDLKPFSRSKSWKGCHAVKIMAEGSLSSLDANPNKSDQIIGRTNEIPSKSAAKTTRINVLEAPLARTHYTLILARNADPIVEDGNGNHESGLAVQKRFTGRFV